MDNNLVTSVERREKKPAALKKLYTYPVEVVDVMNLGVVDVVDVVVALRERRR